MRGKVTVRNYTVLMDHAAVLRAGMYLAGRHEEAEQGGYSFQVMESGRNGVVVKVREVQDSGQQREEDD